jgi:hypothetical protein
MMAQHEVVYHAVLMDRDCELLAEMDSTGINPRYMVILFTPAGMALLGSDEQPPLDELPVGAQVFHRLGSAVYTSAIEASVMYEYVGERL